MQKYPATGQREEVVYDTANGIHVSGDADRSEAVLYPDHIQIQPLAAGTTVDIEVRVSDAALWMVWKNLTNASTPDDLVPQIEKPFPQVRFNRTAGTGDVRVDAVWQAAKHI